MKKLNKYVHRLAPALLAVLIVLGSAGGVNAAVLSEMENPVILDPAAMDATVFPKDDGYYMTLIPDPALTFWERYLDGNLRYTYTGASWTGNSQERLLDNISFKVYPFGNGAALSNEGLTSDAMASVEFNFRFDQTTEITQPFNISITSHVVYYDTLGRLHEDIADTVWTTEYDPLTYGSANRRFEYEFYIDREVDGFFFVYYVVDFSGIDDETVTANVNFVLSSTAELVLPVNEMYGEYVQTGQTNQYLDRLESHLVSQGQTLQDVLTEQEVTNDKLDGIQGSLDDTNDKLDDANDKLDNMPGEIGDEIQGIIDGENDKAESDGNKFVDQVLDLLPDPATDILAAMKNLTSAMAYSGTSAVLPLPALTVPAVPGLIPETVLWDGGTFDFEEYVSVLPDNVLKVAQSLFSVAIVLFCFYELKGIISFALTLRGGGKGGSVDG